MNKTINVCNTDVNITSDGNKVIIRYNNDRDFTYATLKSYTLLEDMLKEMKNYAEEAIKYDDISYFADSINSIDFCDKYFESPVYFKESKRSEEEILMYEKEATDKVWLMRSKPCDNPEIEARRQAAVERILAIYDDIPEEGYNNWECGYWNGVMATLRWVLGDEERDNLDT